jgi:hypothetical protein
MRQLSRVPREPVRQEVYVFRGQYLDASEFYHQEARWMCGRHKWLSPADRWANTEFRNRVLNIPRSDHALQRRMLRANSYFASHFCPVTASSLYQWATGGLRELSILDPCLGWGDRLAAALACPDVARFRGCDPNKNTIRGYERQIEDWGAGRDFSVERCGIEDYAVEEASADVILTSPPYWNLEHYSIDIDQSYIKYVSYDGWREGFLVSLFDKCCSALKGNMYLMFMVQDIFTDRYYPLVQDTMDIASRFPLSIAGNARVTHKSRSIIERPETLLIWRRHVR